MSKGAPIKAMSYFTESVARQGEYWMRPKVEMPEKTESALELRSVFRSGSRFLVAYLGASVSWEGVVPQALVRPSERLLVVCVVTMGLSDCCQSSQTSQLLQHLVFQLTISESKKQES